jgi:hypothetical protein
MLPEVVDVGLNLDLDGGEISFASRTVGLSVGSRSARDVTDDVDVDAGSSLCKCRARTGLGSI